MQFDYTALSLSIPERVQFRYKLEGIDKNWTDAGPRRQAFYNSLPPGNYRFRVMACNNDGLWNEAGATLEFYLVPAFYQTWWFLAVCVFAVGLLALLLIRLRIKAITHQLEARLAVRLDERERIARELHDTLLQGLLGLMLRFQFAAEELPPDSHARAALAQALDQAEIVMTEGRERVKNLRTQEMGQRDLEEELTTIGIHLGTLSPALFTLSVQGNRRALRDAVQAEVLLVAREALMNAYTHSEAKKIHVDVNFQRRCFSLSVQDDGRGIDPEVLRSGRRENHWGLPGMRERMRKLGAELILDSPPSGGTRISLKIPAFTAYHTESSAIHQLFTRAGSILRAWRRAPQIPG